MLNRDIIYTDSCIQQIEDKVQSELMLSIIRRPDEESWDIWGASRILTDPKIVLAVFNTLDEMSIMEIGLLLFMCKRVMITDKAVTEYKTLAKQVDFIEPTCSLKDPNSAFISWYNYTEKQWKS